MKETKSVGRPVFDDDAAGNDDNAQRRSDDIRVIDGGNYGGVGGGVPLGDLVANGALDRVRSVDDVDEVVENTHRDGKPHLNDGVGKRENNELDSFGESQITIMRTDTRLSRMSRQSKTTMRTEFKKHVRLRIGKPGEDRSSFRFLAPCQKFRNFSMYFILNQLAGYPCVAFMGVNILFQMTMIIIGFVFLDNCPMVSRLPIWNVCAGFAFSLKMFTAMMFLGVIRKDVRLTGGVPEKTTIYKSPRYFCLLGMVDCILIALLVLGMTLTLPHLECMTQRLSKGKARASCGSVLECDYLVYFFSVAAMLFLETIYAVGYIMGLWVSGCFHSVSSAEEAAGKIVKGFSKLKNRSTWSIRGDEQRTLKRKARKTQDLERIKKKKGKSRRRRQR